MRACTIAELKARVSRATRHLVLALPHHVPLVKSLIPFAAVASVSFTSLDQMLRDILRLDRPLSVTVISGAEILLRFSREILPAFLREGSTWRVAHTSNRHECRMALEQADVVLVDVVAAGKLTSVHARKCRVINVLDAGSIRRALEVGAEVTLPRPD